MLLYIAVLQTLKTKTLASFLIITRSLDQKHGVIFLKHIGRLYQKFASFDSNLNDSHVYKIVHLFFVGPS